MSAIIFVIILFILFFVLCTVRYEKFTNTPLLIYNTTINDDKIRILMEYSTLNYNKPVYDLLKDIKNVQISTQQTSETKPYIIYTDAFTCIHMPTQFQVVSIFDKIFRKCLFFVKPRDDKKETLLDIVNQGKKIGYITNIDKLLLQYLAMSCHIDKDIVTKLVKKVPLKTDLDKTFFHQHDIHCLMYFGFLSNNQIISNMFKPTTTIDFIDYEGLYDINKVKLIMPFCLIDNIDMRIYYPNNFTDMNPVRLCFMFDTLLCGPLTVLNNDEITYELSNIIVRTGKSEIMNYYTMYFTFHHLALKYLQTINQHIQTRDNLPILEQFNESFYIKHTGNLDGFFDANNQTLKIAQTDINGVPLTKYIKVLLFDQDRYEENGSYFVISNDIDGTLMRKFLILNDSVELSKDQTIKIRDISFIENVPITNLDSQDRIYIKSLNQFAHLSDDKKRLILDKPPLDPTKDPRYECYNKPHIKSRGLCISKYDEMGNSKSGGGSVWDQRCESNSDCPFYQANKNYKNYFGGCLDGYCQMPIGIKRISYTQYDVNSKPFCYRCKNPHDPFCCEDQKDKRKYPNLNSPDYAFPLDQYERMKQIKENWFFK